MDHIIFEKPRPKIKHIILEKGEIQPFSRVRLGKLEHVTGWMHPEKYLAAYSPDGAGAMHFIHDHIGMDGYGKIIQQCAKESTYIMEAVHSAFLDVTNKGKGTLEKMARTNKENLKPFLLAVFDQVQDDVLAIRHDLRKGRGPDKDKRKRKGFGKFLKEYEAGRSQAQIISDLKAKKGKKAEPPPGFAKVKNTWNPKGPAYYHIHPVLGQFEKTLGEAEFAADDLKPDTNKALTIEEPFLKCEGECPKEKAKKKKKLEKGRGKDLKQRKRRGLIKVRNPNPKGEPFIYVKPKKAEKVVGFVPEGTREHLD